MTPKLNLQEVLIELRDQNKEYPRRIVTTEENCNILLNEVYSTIYNKIENMSPYDRRDKGWDVLLDFIETKFDIIQSFLKDMNEETWSSRQGCVDE